MAADTAGPFGLILTVYRRILTVIVYVLAAFSGAGILTMMGVTFLDVLLRYFGRPIPGAYDIVQITAAITIAGALPYTTAVKGHVAIEFLFHKLGRTGRIFMDTFIRIIAIGLFAFLSYQSAVFGNQLLSSGRLTMTLQIPLYWIPYIIALSSGVVVLVTFDNLMHPGKEMIKP